MKLQVGQTPFAVRTHTRMPLRHAPLEAAPYSRILAEIPYHTSLYASFHVPVLAIMFLGHRKGPLYRSNWSCEGGRWRPLVLTNFMVGILNGNYYLYGS